MDFAKMNAFVMVADTMSFSKAADALYKSQSVLSRQIKSFEEELGVTLFNRTTKAVALTQEGKILYEGFKKILDCYEETLQSAQAAADGYSGVLRVGIPAGQLLNDNYLPFINGFKQKYPDVYINLRADNLYNLRKMIVDDNLDVILARKSDFGDEIGAQNIEIGRAKVILAISRSHRLAEKKASELKLSDFKNDYFLAHPYRETPTNKRTIEKLCAASGFAPKIKIMPDLSTINVWLEANWGVTLMNTSHVLRDCPSIRFVDIFPELTVDESVIYIPGHPNACKKVFLESALEFAAKKAASTFF